jgi:hypothetical protein
VCAMNDSRLRIQASVSEMTIFPPKGSRQRLTGDYICMYLFWRDMCTVPATAVLHKPSVPHSSLRTEPSRSPLVSVSPPLLCA